MSKKVSKIKNLIPKTVNPDLQKERLAASFDVEEFAAWWQGGEKKLKTKREIGKCGAVRRRLSLSLSLSLSLARVDKKVQAEFVCDKLQEFYFLILWVSKYSKCRQSPVDNILYLIASVNCDKNNLVRPFIYLC